MKVVSMNIYDVAKEAGVSPATVSRVLNESKSVKKETREKVLSVIKGKNYVPNVLARNLSSGECRNIAFVVPDIENPFFGKILHGITDKARDRNYNIFMFGTDEDPKKELQVLNSLKTEMIKGLIVIPVSEYNRETELRLSRFEKQNVPVVLVDRDIMGAEFDGVFSEDAEGVYEAMDLLIKEGHKNIAIIAGFETSRPGYERLKGYKKALEDNGIELNPAYIVNGKFREEESYRAMKALMEMENPPTAIFASNNLATLGCLRYMKERGLKLGRDISLIGFDDIKELEYAGLNLTVVTRPVYEMGCEAMELLESRFQGRDSGNAAHKAIIRRNYAKTWLIKRGSEKYIKSREKKGNE